MTPGYSRHCLSQVPSCVTSESLSLGVGTLRAWCNLMLFSRNCEVEYPEGMAVQSPASLLKFSLHFSWLTRRSGPPSSIRTEPYLIETVESAHARDTVRTFTFPPLSTTEKPARKRNPTPWRFIGHLSVEARRLHARKTWHIASRFEHLFAKARKARTRATWQVVDTHHRTTRRIVFLLNGRLSAAEVRRRILILRRNFLDPGGASLDPRKRVRVRKVASLSEGSARRRCRDGADGGQSQNEARWELHIVKLDDPVGTGNALVSCVPDQPEHGAGNK